MHMRVMHNKRVLVHVGVCWIARSFVSVVTIFVVACLCAWGVDRANLCRSGNACMCVTDL
jgi:hypothetical protein